ncbi:hypothetical protein P154DRAFT_519879 [Amniculicola lignicola CBS 123094]|uniref:TPR domain-containing protein n=1 Tax=Amniculicola lignicola CBS 123094 TaxID=1392246 RepID=A0A6A5WX32_9PLEO|nr:hypothetical protein P154DRAFT_519879 [Amniculicola lignicola CBS 123094]
MFPIAIGGIVISLGILVIFVPLYYHYAIKAPYHNFPEPVAQKLRRAVYYTVINPDIREANKYFRMALEVAKEMGMNPFSDEVLGIKLSVSDSFEKAGHYKYACDVLEVLRADCKRYIEMYGERFQTTGDRARVLKRLVEISVKLGDLYDTKYMNEPENAERVLTDALEIALRERARRETEGVKQGEGEWMTPEELGATMESLGSHYEQFDQHYLATPLFLQALTLCPPKSCHGVVLMNNISTCLAQQTPPPASLSTSTGSLDAFPDAAAPPRTVLIDQARQWALKAIAHAATITPPDRNEECDVGCAVATHNLAEFFEQQGSLKEARLKYEEAASLAKAAGFREGQVNARAGLKRLKGV